MTNIDLYTLTSTIKGGLEDLFPDRIWVKAEISSLMVKNGHCYMELCQSTPQGEIVAKARAMIWSSRYRLIAPYFMETAGTALKEGMQILAQVQVNYTQLYGLSLVINDIDAEFALGVKELERQRTIARLEAEGYLERQQALVMAALPYRIAVISAEGAAGYGDFVRHLDENEYGFVLCADLFPALMQGTDSPSSIIGAIGRVVRHNEDHPDKAYEAVLILRGGGAKLDMVTYDDYSLAVAIATCPLPVFTAVGHDRDRHVCDMVAYRAVKTPTALADEMLSYYEAEDERLASYASVLRAAFLSKISSMEAKVDVLEHRIVSADPRNVLKRGYILALSSSGVVVKSTSSVNPGDKLRLMFSDGTIGCNVETVSLSDNVNEQ